MKKLLFITTVLCAAACGGASSEQGEVLSEQEEAELVETITADLDEVKEDLIQETEESLSEIDSLLENF